METKKIDSKASALKFIANRIDSNFESYSNRQSAQSIRAKINNLANVFNGLASMASYKDPLQTAESHFIKVSTHANSLLKNSTAEQNQLFENYRSYYLQIEKEILTSTGLSNPSPFGDEVRKTLKEMSSEQRTNKMLDLVKKNESSVLGAIYPAPAFLSGLTEGEKDAHFKVYFAQHAPELLNERKNLDDTFDSVNSFMRSYRNSLNSFIDPRKIREIEREKELADNAQAELTGALRASI